MKLKSKPSKEKPPATAVAEEETVVAPAQPELRRVHVLDGKLHEIRRNRFFYGHAPLASLPGIELVATPPPIGCMNSLRRISYDEWKQFCSFHRWSVSEYSAETMLSHMLTSTGEHMTLPFHQEVTRGAMTIAVDYTTPENTALLERLQREHGINTGDFHGTTHNHVRMSAFASGVDKDDEIDKQGWHFTIGHCDKPELSIDGRVRMKFSPTFDEDGNMLTRAHTMLLPVVDWTSLIDIPHVDPDMPLDLRKASSLFWLTRCKDEGFPDEWKDYVTLRKFAPTTTTTGYGNYNNSQYWKDRQQQMGFGHGFHGEEEWEYARAKKQMGGGESAARTITTPKAAPNKGAQLVVGALNEEKADEVLDQPGRASSLSRQQYRKYATELRILDMFAANMLTVTDAWNVIRIMQEKRYLDLYGADGVVGRVLTQMIDDTRPIHEIELACMRLAELFTAAPGYVVSVPPAESPANRKALLASFVAPDA